MRELWRYIQIKDNRELLAFVCGGLAAIVTAGWVAYTHFSKKETSDKTQTTISAPNGVAAGTIIGSPFTVNPPAVSAASSNSTATVPK